MLSEGRDRDRLIAATIQIENEFSDQFKVAPVSGVTAQLSYRGSDKEHSWQTNRGAWLNNGNRIGFLVNDINNLVIAFFQEENEQYVAVVVKEYQSHRSDDALASVSALLTEDYYRVRVRLISEHLGMTYGEQEYDLEIERDPVDITLTSLVELSADEIRQRLERFL